MKFSLKKPILFLALSALSIATPVFEVKAATEAKHKKWSNKKVAVVLEDILNGKKDGYIEDHLRELAENGHMALAQLVLKLKNNHSEIPSGLRMVAYITQLVIEHRIPPALALRIKEVLEKFKNRDHIWRAALDNSKPNITVLRVHTEDRETYVDEEGQQHEVTAKADVEITDEVKRAAVIAAKTNDAA